MTVPADRFHGTCGGNAQLRGPDALNHPCRQNNCGVRRFAQPIVWRRMPTNRSTIKHLRNTAVFTLTRIALQYFVSDLNSALSIAAPVESSHAPTRDSKSRNSFQLRRFGSSSPNDQHHRHVYSGVKSVLTLANSVIHRWSAAKPSLALGV